MRLAALFLLLVMAKDTITSFQADMSDVKLRETLSQIKSAQLIENNTLDNNHEKQDCCAPIFKHPTKMYGMDMKPAGSSIRLRCAAEGNPTPNVTWYKNKSTPITRNYFHPSYGKWSMVVDELTKADNGNYTCVVCNQLGCINHTTTLHVQAMPIQEAPYNGKYISMTNILTIVLGAMIFIGVIIVVMICKKLKRHKQRDIEIARVVIETFWIKKVVVEKPQIDSLSDALLKPVVKIEKQKVSRVQNKTSGTMMMSEYELQVDIDWEVPRETLVLGKVLGQGEFGKVVKAECVGVLKSRMQSVVAVKMLKEGHTDAEMTALVSEMEMMKMIGKHVNIINFLGCCTQDGPLFVIVEYAPNGNLREFLRNHRPENSHQTPIEVWKEKKTLTEKDLVWFSYQVARGMEYLVSRRCIHCDLAARNVLVTRDCILKIADFGLAKDVQSKGYYRKQTEGKLPARWMAPESLSDIIFNTQTDVWSFGVLLWEIMTLGAMPYPKVPGQFLYQYLSAGHRLKKPLLCSLEIYMLMCKCWSFSAGDRPSFTKLVEDLEKILTDIENHIPHLRATMELETKVKKFDL